MNDSISRQAAIDAIMEEPSEVRYPVFYAEKIRQLTTADVVERKRGKWIYNEVGGWHCSECGAQAPFWCFATTQNLANFCQNCGARMKKGVRKMGVCDKDDLISRRAAIDALDSINCFGWVEDSWKNVCGIIERVPTTQQEKEIPKRVLWSV